MSSRIRIKLGEIEVEYEGPESFLKEELPDLLEAVSKLHRDAGAASADTPEVDEGSQGSGGVPQATTKTIAGKLNCKTGPDLAIAAAARLTIVLKGESFTRLTLHNEMKSASSYYKKSFGNNLTKTIDGLVKSGKFVEPASGKLTLGVDEKKRLEAALASS